MIRYSFGDPSASSILVQMVDDHDLSVIGSEVSAIRELAGEDFYLLALKVESWNRDLSPWNAPPVFGDVGFGDGAEETLETVLAELGPAEEGKRYFIGGYSLAGLFALWCAYRTDRFSGAAAASPSVWFPGFTDYMKEKELYAKTVYLSLGDREERTRNPVMSTVGTRIREAYDLLQKAGARCILEWNKGNHFKEPDLRTAKAFAWVLKNAGASQGARSDKMKPEELKEIWIKEEETAHIHGWDFSHIEERYEEEGDLPWSYDAIVRQYLKDDRKILDYDTGGGEYLLSLRHPYGNTAATEGYPPNVELCREVLAPLGIDFRECSNASAVPFPDQSFDMVINRHGDFDPAEIWRLLKPGGVFITQQVGGENDRELVEMVLPDTEPPFSHANLREQRQAFENAGFRILQADEAFRPIRFYDIGAFVWFARVIEWEFPGFSVDRCFEALLKMQEKVEENGFVEGTVHRYLIVSEKTAPAADTLWG